MAETVATADRKISDAEVEFFHENGWVALPGLIKPEVAAEILVRVQSLWGARDQADARKPDTVGLVPYDYAALADDFLHKITFSKEAGRNVQRLIGRDVPVRYWHDQVACKFPAGKDSRATETKWHQDQPYMPIDRNGLMIWLALVDLTPEMGTMRFVSRSMHEGMLGRLAKSPTSVFELYPRLKTNPVSNPMSLSAGDATIHHDLTLHYASGNTSDRPRWAYIRGYIPGDSLYTGSPHFNTDGLGLELNKPLDHPRFSIIYP